MQPGALHVTLLREKVDTMVKLMEFVTKKYPNKRCLGTREIFGEEDEKQSNGKVFKKVRTELNLITGDKESKGKSANIDNELDFFHFDKLKYLL